MERASQHKMLQFTARCTYCRAKLLSMREHRLNHTNDHIIDVGAGCGGSGRAGCLDRGAPCLQNHLRLLEQLLGAHGELQRGLDDGPALRRPLADRARSELSRQRAAVRRDHALRDLVGDNLCGSLKLLNLLAGAGAASRSGSASARTRRARDRTRALARAATKSRESSETCLCLRECRRGRI